ncbi:hypothetical protein ACFXPR_15095 [Nocardia tengchongensis]|uniref:hypothetical protein n=2 Tax=Nocardiaceae TaxID=85025 RepID=UPI0036D1C083
MLGHRHEGAFGQPRLGRSEPPRKRHERIFEFWGFIVLSGVMGLARTGTRILDVDGERFRWVVAPDDEPGLAIVVEIAEGQGQRMVTWVDHGTVITPGVVAEIIRKALRNGWTPKQRNRQITYRVQDAKFTTWPPLAP